MVFLCVRVIVNLGCFFSVFFFKMYLQVQLELILVVVYVRVARKECLVSIHAQLGVFLVVVLVVVVILLIDVIVVLAAAAAAAVFVLVIIVILHMRLTVVELVIVGCLAPRIVSVVGAVVAGGQLQLASESVKVDRKVNLTDRLTQVLVGRRLRR